jgi:hypothetical protein
MHKQKLLIIGTVWPEPNSSAAGSRMLQLMELFRGNGYRITFASAAAGSEFSADLESLDIEKVSIELNNKTFDAFIQELQPAIVLFDRFMTEEQFGWRVAENCPGAIRILDTEDLHCLRYGRQSAWKSKREFCPADLLNDHAMREIATIYRCDLSLIISHYEMELLLKHFKVDTSLLLYLPFMPDPVKANGWTGFPERTGFITIGNFLHEPNWNSVQYLKEEIWPLIRKQLPEATLRIYGAYTSQKAFALNDPGTGFCIMGRAADSGQVTGQARVLLAPLRYGAGLKGKLLDAMRYGTPNVTTPVGAEGMQGELEWSGLIANDAAGIAAAAVKLYTDQELWEQSRKNGIRIIKTNFSKSEHEKRLLKAVSALHANLQAHRAANFTGAMLMHHTISGTKYMSRWIEEKNKHSIK